MTSEYAIAVHGLVFLSHKNTVVSSEALAENICTNPARVRKVMARLKKAGLVETREGADGGYRISVDAKQITLKTVADALEVAFVRSSWRSGNPDMECLIASGMANALDGIFSELDAVCRNRLESITVADLENQLFGAV